MENLLKFRRLYPLLLLLPLAFSTAYKENNSPDWGFFGHKRINRIAIFTLPREMIGFYKENIEYITEHSIDPDKRRYAVEGEAQCHYIDLDHYYKPGENPFLLVPKKWTEAVAKYTEDTLQAYGIVPWHIQVVKYK